MRDNQVQRLYDTSALLNLILKGSRSLFVLQEQAVLDLTIYELGNSIWKISYLQKKITKEEACNLLEVCLTVRTNMNVMNIQNIEEEVKELSTETGLSFYDSSYLALAKIHNLILVTDDKRLARAAIVHKIKTSTSE